jgi:hypothetical protein
MPEIICPTDCAVANLPVINFESCNPQILGSEIQAIFVGRQDAIDFLSIISATEWNDRISETNVPPALSTVAVKDLLRKLVVIGDIPAPEQTSREISGGRTVVTRNRFTINFEIDDASDENWQFVQTVECGKGAYPVKAWPVTKSLHVIGGNNGIEGTMKIDPILDRGADGIQRFVGTITFDKSSFPNRDVFPISL